ncbi:MAG TPA: hypothetical protein VM261_29810, partial [Kofleriaceae bacterium]|nr:hypothetical protein [Kofleriaceae bacterium]
SMAPGTTAASSAPGATDLPGPGVTAWAARLGAQRGVIYAGGQLTIRYAVQANKADASLADIAFTYVNQSPGTAAVQFSVQGRDDSLEALWSRRLGGRLNAGASAVATVTTALSSFPLSISVGDVRLCPIGADDSTSSSTSALACAQVKPEKGDTARLRRPANAQ